MFFEHTSCRVGFLSLGFRCQLSTEETMPSPPPMDDPRHAIHLARMELAIEEARRAILCDEAPIGAAIFHLDGSLLAKAHNLRETRQDPTAHAELIAMVEAAKAIGSWRLEDTILYVTLEPCPMCAGVIVQSRVPYVVYGATDPKAGACHTLYHLTHDERLNHRAEVLGGVEAERCGRMLTEFFAAKRRMGKK
jgi:tRNA(adenine34) deaminase